LLQLARLAEARGEVGMASPAAACLVITLKHSDFRCVVLPLAMDNRRLLVVRGSWVVPALGDHLGLHGVHAPVEDLQRRIEITVALELPYRVDPFGVVPAAEGTRGSAEGPLP
jgi:hypothetical protein